MTNVRVRTIGAVFNGQPIGSEIELTKVEADHYASLGYIEILAKAVTASKSESAPKAVKPTPKKSKTTKDDAKK